MPVHDGFPLTSAFRHPHDLERIYPHSVGLSPPAQEHNHLVMIAFQYQVTWFGTGSCDMNVVSDLAKWPLDESADST